MEFSVPRVLCAACSGLTAPAKTTTINILHADSSDVGHRQGQQVRRCRRICQGAPEHSDVRAVHRGRPLSPVARTWCCSEDCARASPSEAKARAEELEQFDMVADRRLSTPTPGHDATSISPPRWWWRRRFFSRQTDRRPRPRSRRDVWSMVKLAGPAGITMLGPQYLEADLLQRLNRSHRPGRCASSGTADFSQTEGGRSMARSPPTAIYPKVAAALTGLTGIGPHRRPVSLLAPDGYGHAGCPVFPAESTQTSQGSPTSPFRASPLPRRRFSCTHRDGAVTPSADRTGRISPSVRSVSSVPRWRIGLRNFRVAGFYLAVPCYGPVH